MDALVYLVGDRIVSGVLEQAEPVRRPVKAAHPECAGNVLRVRLGILPNPMPVMRGPCKSMDISSLRSLIRPLPFDFVPQRLGRLVYRAFPFHRSLFETRRDFLHVVSLHPDHVAPSQAMRCVSASAITARASACRS